MAFRELVTGNDACMPADGGAGPSNAMASLADSLLGRSSKAQERLREVCSPCSAQVLRNTETSFTVNTDQRGVAGPRDWVLTCSTKAQAHLC